jgi:cytochrome P450
MTGTIAPNPIRQVPPRTAGLPIVGALPALLRRPFPFFLEARERYGDVYTLDLGIQRMLVFNQPQHAQHILVEQSNNYPKGKSVQSDAVQTLFGNGLLTSEGALWLRQRRMIQPHFHRQQLTGLASLMVEAIDQSFQSWLIPSARTPFNLSPAFAAMTMQVILKILFGQALQQSQFDAVRAAITFVVDYLIWAILMPDLPGWLPLPGMRRYQQALRTIAAAVQMVIDQQRRVPEPANHLLATLLQLVDAETGERMSDRQLRDEIVTFFLAGYETTSLALAWSLHFLSQLPDMRRQLVAEVDAVLGGRPPAFADLPNLVYTRMVIQEALRMRPPAWHLTRTATEADTIDGYSIAAGTTVALQIYAIHHHPQHWPEPERFDPQRFSPEHSVDRHKYAWIPFSAGQRQCIGKDFSLMEAQLILAMLLQRYTVDAIPGYVATPQLSTALKARGGVRVALATR